MYINSNVSSFLLSVFKGVIITLLITLVSVLLFAFVLSVANLSDKVIKPTNQIIKTVSVLLGVVLTVRESRFLIKGGLIGLLSAFFSVLLFSLIASVAISFATVMIDLSFGFLTGALSGLMASKILNWLLAFCIVFLCNQKLSKKKNF